MFNQIVQNVWHFSDQLHLLIVLSKSESHIAFPTRFKPTINNFMDLSLMTMSLVFTLILFQLASLLQKKMNICCESNIWIFDLRLILHRINCNLQTFLLALIKSRNV